MKNHIKIILWIFFITIIIFHSIRIFNLPNKNIEILESYIQSSTDSIEIIIITNPALLSCYSCVDNLVSIYNQTKDVAIIKIIFFYTNNTYNPQFGTPS